MKIEEINEILEKIKTDGDWITKLPEKLITKEICLDAINSGQVEVLQKIPLELRTKEICLEAIKHNPSDIDSVPKDILTEKMCLDAILIEKNKNNSWGFSVLSSIPEEFRTKKVCLEAVKQDPYALYNVPEHLEPIIVNDLGEYGQEARRAAKQLCLEREYELRERDGEKTYDEKKQVKKDEKKPLFQRKRAASKGR